MIIKCSRCNRKVRVDFANSETSDECCPYCGQVFLQKDRERIRENVYFIKHKLPKIIVAIVLSIFIFSFIVMICKK